jgi:hypothetical protein
MIIVRKNRGKPVVFILIAANVVLICVALVILFWPARVSRTRPRPVVELHREDAVETGTQAPATSTVPGENDAFFSMRVTQVYAHNASRLYYPEDCHARPEKAYKVARTLAIKQGFTLAPGCFEPPDR